MPKDSKPAPKKDPKILDAEITEDGAIMITLNQNPPAFLTPKVILTPELVWSLAQEFGEIPEAKDTDFPGVPVVDADDVFNDDEEEETEDQGDGGGAEEE